MERAKNMIKNTSKKTKNPSDNTFEGFLKKV